MEKVLLPNYGFVKTKLPKNIYSSVLKECLNMKGKEEFTSGLTEPGVTMFRCMNTTEFYLIIFG